MASTLKKDVQTEKPYDEAIDQLLGKKTPQDVLMETFRQYKGLMPIRSTAQAYAIVQKRDEADRKVLHSLKKGLFSSKANFTAHEQIVGMLTEIVCQKSMRPISGTIRSEAAACLVEEIDLHGDITKSPFITYRLKDNFKALKQIAQENPSALSRKSVANTLADFAQAKSANLPKPMNFLVHDAMDVLWSLEKKSPEASDKKEYIWDEVVQGYIDAVSFELKDSIPQEHDSDYLLRVRNTPFGERNEYENTSRYEEIKGLSLVLCHALNTYKLTSPKRKTDDIHLSEDVADMLKVSYLSTGWSGESVALLNVYWNKYGLMTVIGNNVYSPHAAVGDERLCVLDDLSDVVKGNAKRAAPYRKHEPT